MPYIEGRGVYASSDYGMPGQPPEVPADRVKALEAENARLRAALQTIRDNYGQVCEEFEICQHPACASSCGAWLLADDALKGTTPHTNATER